MCSTDRVISLGQSARCDSGEDINPATFENEEEKSEESRLCRREHSNHLRDSRCFADSAERAYGAHLCWTSNEVQNPHVGAPRGSARHCSFTSETLNTV